MSTWVGEKGYCIRVADAASASEPYVSFDPTDGIACVEHATVYCASFYFSVMTITSIGYGDISATPLNPIEQWICSILMLVGSFLWAKVPGSML